MQPETRSQPSESAKKLQGLHLILIGDWPPPFGGVAIHLRNLMEAARQNGAEVQVVDIGKGQHNSPGIRSANTPLRLLFALGQASRQSTWFSPPSSVDSRKKSSITSPEKWRGNPFRMLWEDSRLFRTSLQLPIRRHKASWESRAAGSPEKSGQAESELEKEFEELSKKQVPKRASVGSRWPFRRRASRKTSARADSAFSSSNSSAHLHLRVASENLNPQQTAVPFSQSPAPPLQQRTLIHLHTSGANPKSWLLTSGVGLFSRLSGIPAVVSFHSGHGPRYLNTPARALSARAALSSFERVVCVNQEISLALSRLGAASNRHLVAPAFGSGRLEPGELPLSAQQILAQGQQLVVAMLAPGEDYGQQELFAAMAKIQPGFPSTTLAIYGPGTDSPSCRRAARGAGLRRILHLGPIPHEQALALMQVAQVFVRPSRVDGDAVSVREALAIGARVVATRVGHRPEGVHLCEPKSPTQLAESLKEALSLGRPEVAPRQNEDGIDTILNLYSELLSV